MFNSLIKSDLFRVVSNCKSHHPRGKNSHPQEIKQMGLILIKSETIEIFTIVFCISINKKCRTKADFYQEVSEKIKAI